MMQSYRGAIRLLKASAAGRKRAVVSSCLRGFSTKINGQNDSDSAAGSSSCSSNGMKVYNSLSSNYQTLPSQNQNPSSTNMKSHPRGTAWYVCGPTVYDSAHLGHGRTYVSLDIMRRVALSLHNQQSNNAIVPRPLYVMNITDVDDKIIQRSMERQTLLSTDTTTTTSTSHSETIEDQLIQQGQEQEADPLALARKYEVEFWSDMDALNILPPDVICRVSEHVNETIVPYIEQIVRGGMAYVIPEGEGDQHDKDVNGSVEGSVYFDVRAFESKTNGLTRYGKLAPDVASSDFFSWENNPEQNQEGNVGNSENSVDDEGEPIRRKCDPRDFCLWKYRPRSIQSSTNQTNTIIEPASVSYNSPWGPGRPGWHVECSAMIQRLSQDFAKTHEFSVHAGGVDLKFPHHSNEIAQAEAYNAAAATATENDDGGEFKEWIDHWIHTGHLYVKGRKMSKSLKNFITIGEMLGTTTTPSNTKSESTAIDQSGNAWISPADDFRLWVLGLSGAYRGPATYSKDRMEEARVTREKWIRFLMEGQELLDRLKGSNNNDANISAEDISSRLWGNDELELFQNVTQSSMTCREALLDDLDGSSFVKELNRIADVGLAYIDQTKTNHHSKTKKNLPEEPLRFVLDTFRGQLDLVGFTSRTVNAGISSHGIRTSGQSQLGSTSSSGNAAMIDEAVAFRTAVRAAALGAIRKKKKDDASPIDAIKDILVLCDEMRDDSFPKLGVEILDGKVVASDDKDADGCDVIRGWRYCSPR